MNSSSAKTSQPREWIPYQAIRRGDTKGPLPARRQAAVFSRAAVPRPVEGEPLPDPVRACEGESLACAGVLFPWPRCPSSLGMAVGDPGTIALFRHRAKIHVDWRVLRSRFARRN